MIWDVHRGSEFYSNPGSGSATLQERRAYPAGSPVVAAVEQAEPLRLQPQPLRHLDKTNKRLAPIHHMSSRQMKQLINRSRFKVNRKVTGHERAVVCNPQNLVGHRWIRNHTAQVYSEI